MLIMLIAGSVIAYLALGLLTVYTFGTADQAVDSSGELAFIVLLWPVVGLIAVVMAFFMLAEGANKLGMEVSRRHIKNTQRLTPDIEWTPPDCKCNGGKKPCPVLSPVRKR